MKLAAAIGALALIVVGAGPASADKCIGTKVKAIGKKEGTLITCQAKIATRGTAAVQPDCDTKAVDKFTFSYDRPGVCGAPSANACEMLADDCRDQVRAALPDGDDTNPSTCEAARLKAAGKKAYLKLACYAKATSKGLAVDSTCLAKADVKFSKNYSKVSGCTGDGQMAAVESLIDDVCVDALLTLDGNGMITAICPAGGGGSSTSSSSTTTSSSSTTTDAGGTTTTFTSTTGTTGSTGSSSTTTSSSSTTSTSSPPTCDVCTQGPALDANCDPCAVLICQNNPSCCTDAWDALCVAEACTFCNYPCAGTLCAAPTCSDGIQNQSETDVDCGGSNCSPCASGRTCLQNSDCISSSCTNNVCD